MPSKSEVIEDMLAQVETEFHRVLTRPEYPNFFGGSVRIVYSTAPRVTVEIAEAKRPGPKVGSRFKKDASRQAAKRLQKQEEYGNHAEF